MKGITRLVLLLWFVLISLQGPINTSGEKAASNESITVPTIQPQNATFPTPRRVEPVLPGAKPTETAEKVVNTSSTSTTTTSLPNTTEGSTEKPEEDDSNQEEQQPPTIEEEKPGKIDESKRNEPKEESSKELPKPQEFRSKANVDSIAEPEDSNFLYFMIIGLLLIFCIYLLQHNKKKILGLMFEGRSSNSHRRNVRYRKLSQREEEQYKDDIVY